MARKISYNINRFDGGMTDDIRNLSDLSKCSYVSHFDIYDSPNKMRTMPGFSDLHAISGDSDGAKAYGIRGFYMLSNTILVGIGTRANGSGCKMWWIDDVQLDGTDEWIVPTGGFDGHEFDSELADFPWMACVPNQDVNEGVYFPTTSGGSTYLTNLGSNPVENQYQISSGTSDFSSRIIIQQGSDDRYYINDTGRGVHLMGTWSDIDTQTADETITIDEYLSEALVTTDITRDGNYLWVMGFDFRPYVTKIVQFDTAANSAAGEAVQTITLEGSRGGVIGVAGGVIVSVVDEFIDSSKNSSATELQANGRSAVSVQAIVGKSTETLYRLVTDFTTADEFWPTKGFWRDGFTFYGKFTMPDGVVRQGIWAVSRRSSSSPVALSHLLDTTTLGQMDGYAAIANIQLFAHGGDGSISHLSNFDSGTYDITASYESLMFGSENAHDKQLNGLSVTTTDLPSGGSVEVSYRTDPEDTWTSMGTSSTTGEKVHHFTRVSGTPIGNFKEIQFKIEVTGKVDVSRLELSLTELDDKPYNS